MTSIRLDKHPSVDADEFSPDEVLRRMRQCDELYAVGKALYWTGLRHDYPDASEDELEQHWQAMLERRRRGK